MKKIILFCICVALFSCKKDHSKTPTTQQKKYPVTFDVSGFTQTIVNSTQKQVNGLKAADLNAPSNYANELLYWVFYGNGAPVHYLVQYSSNANFGHIADSLQAGDYIVAIAAGKGGLTAINTSAIFNLGLTYGGPWKDTFLKTFSVHVTNDGHLNQTVNLDRIVGQLEVQIQDAIPAKASTLSIVANPEYLNYSVINNKTTDLASSNVTFTQTIPATAIGTTNYTIDDIIGNTTSAFLVTITCYDAAKNVLGSTVVHNVTCKKNTRTILKGNLFGDGNAFNLTLNTGWVPDPVLIPFNIKNY